MFAGVLISIAVSSLATRILGPAGYGDLKFVQNIFELTITCASIGVFVSGGRLLANQTDEMEKKALIGSLIIGVIIIAILIMSAMWAFSFIVGRLFDNESGPLIRSAVPLLFVYPLQLCLENVLKGDNKIYSLSAYRIAPNIIYLFLLLILSNFLLLSAGDFLLLLLSCIAFTSLCFLVYLRPGMKAAMRNIGELIRETNSYGIKVYQGILAGTASAQLGGITVAYFIDTVAVGYFLLSQMITMPLVMIFSNIGTAFFKSFTQHSCIPKKVRWMSILIAAFTLFGFMIFIDDLVSILYPKAFQPVIAMSRIMAIGAILLGAGDIINNFVCAKGYGHYARNAAIVRGLINVIGFTVLTRFFGINGAVITVLIAGSAFFVTIYYYYTKIRISA